MVARLHPTLVSRWTSFFISSVKLWIRPAIVSQLCQRSSPISSALSRIRVKLIYRMEPLGKRWTNRTAFVTGGNSGIGAAIVTRLIDIGINVVSFDKNIDNLEALAAKNHGANDKGKLYPIKGDLRNEEEMVSAFDWVEKNLGAVHILVNNAGCGDGYTLLNFNTERWRQVLEVNVLALAICTREAVKSMMAHSIDEGHVFNIDRQSTLD